MQRLTDWISGVLMCVCMCLKKCHSKGRESEAWRVYGGHYFSLCRFPCAEADGK